MERPINIHRKKEVVYLKATRYRIYTLGGFGVKQGQFSITFKHTETHETLKCVKAFWPVQTFAFGKRAKRVFVVDVPKDGHYEVIFNHPETLRIKPSNLPIKSLFQKEIPNNQIEILISSKLGMLPFGNH